MPHGASQSTETHRCARSLAMPQHRLLKRGNALSCGLLLLTGCDVPPVTAICRLPPSATPEQQQLALRSCMGQHVERVSLGGLARRRIDLLVVIRTDPRREKARKVRETSRRDWNEWEFGRRAAHRATVQLSAASRSASIHRSGRDGPCEANDLIRGPAPLTNRRVPSRLTCRTFQDRPARSTQPGRRPQAEIGPQ